MRLSSGYSGCLGGRDADVCRAVEIFGRAGVDHGLLGSANSGRWVCAAVYGWD